MMAQNKLDIERKKKRSGHGLDMNLKRSGMRSQELDYLMEEQPSHSKRKIFKQQRDILMGGNVHSLSEI